MVDYIFSCANLNFRTQVLHSATKTRNIPSALVYTRPLGLKEHDLSFESAHTHCGWYAVTLALYEQILLWHKQVWERERDLEFFDYISEKTL